jgi:transcription factor MYB, plant
MRFENLLYIEYLNFYLLYSTEALKTEMTSPSMDVVQELTKEDYAENKSHFNQVALTHSKKFPKSAQMLFEALKNNRSCQKFVRRKLIEIETKIEENKVLRDRVKCLMDFQLACKKKAGRALAQKQDPRIRLISIERLKESQEGHSEVSFLSFFCILFGFHSNLWELVHDCSLHE